MLEDIAISLVGHQGRGWFLSVANENTFFMEIDLTFTSLLEYWQSVSAKCGKWGQPGETAGFVVAVCFVPVTYYRLAVDVHDWELHQGYCIELLISLSVPSPWLLLPYPFQNKDNGILLSQIQLYFHIFD